MTPEPSTRNDSPPERQPVVAKNNWVVPVTWLGLVALLLGSGLYVFKSCRDLPVQTLDRTGRLVNELGQQLEKVAAAFKQGTITTTFTSYATTISGSQYLQFATLSQAETFTRKDESSLAFGYVPLPDVIVQASAPVTYTYYLDLNARWDFRLEGGVIYVVAPDIRYNKPAVDVSRMTYEVKKNSMIRNTTEALENLKSSITGMSFKKAEANIELVRETGRRQTETFVHNWLAKSFSDGKNYPVKVMFRSEVKNQANGVVPKPE